jgi:Trk K+ transport system NAD-binding subunit
MKTAGLQAMLAMSSRRIQHNALFLIKFCAVLALLVVIYALLFDLFMHLEGKEYSFVTGLYWALTTMTTLGYGDITFQSDLGRGFSIVVLLTGMVFMLVLLPFLIIEFVYTPMLKAQQTARAPRELPPDTRGHVILTSHDAITQALIPRLVADGTPYALIIPDINEALSLGDQGLRVMVGDVADPETLRRARVEQAALVAATADNDPLNTNVVFTVRQLSEALPVVATARNTDSVDILDLAGATQVLLMSELMGNALARHAGGGSSEAHVLGVIGGVVMVEAHASGTPWVGKTLAEAAFGERLGLTVAGIWERGKFELAGPQTRITESSVLFMGLSPEQLRRYNALVGSEHRDQGAVLIIGGGAVGQATARALRDRGIEYRIVERVESRRGPDAERTVTGDAADLSVLRNAGLEEAHAVIVTPNVDDINIFLTIYCRRLRPEVRIISRATAEHNVATLHRAGADFVMSYATMGASAVFNHLRHGGMLMMVEGLFAKRVPIPPGIQGRSLIEAQVRSRTGCSVVALEQAGEISVNPSPTAPLPSDGFLTLIVTPETEQRFQEAYGR